MAEADAEQRIGKVIDGRYKLVQVMASGSMGAVYQGERVPVGKVVAIKFLHASFKNDREFQARFERETRVMSKLAHPNCVSVLDFGVFEDAPYLVMDFVAGTTLRARLDKGPLPAAQALAFAKQITAGLAHAHEQDIIHRDIKPANVMITDEVGSGERVRILDFGLARLRGNVGRDATQTNMVVGTPNYMAPEQTVGGSTIDARTDIYAVGVVLFEMIVGDRPFFAEDTLQLLGMHRAAPIPRIADRVKEGTDVPPGLQEVIDKAMAKSPKDRYQTALELAKAIDDVAVGNIAVPEEDATIPRTGPVPVPARKTKTSSVALAPTMVQIDTGQIDLGGGPKPMARFWRTMLGAILVVGGAAAMAGYLIHRGTGGAAMDEGASGLGPRASGDAGSAVANVDTLDASSPEARGPRPEAPTPDAAPAQVVEAPPADAPGPDALLDDAGLPIIGPADELDPNIAIDLDPQAGSGSGSNDDEAADAPKNVAEVEKKPQPVQLARSFPEAVQLIKDGKRDVALASLRALRKSNPRNASIPFLLGNLYYDQRWWSVAMDDYADAIKKNPAYKANATLNRNVIRMLGSPKTQSRAAGFLRNTIGHASLVYLKQAAKNEDNSIVKKQAAALSRSIR